MDTPKIFDSELKLCEILWQHQPVKSSELVRLCADQLGWKKSTTYSIGTYYRIISIAYYPMFGVSMHLSLPKL